MEEKKGGPNIKYILVGILFTLQAVGFYDHIWNIDPNTCDMTYMWQAPEYIVSMHLTLYSFIYKYIYMVITNCIY